MFDDDRVREQSDDALVELLRGGDEAAAGELYARHCEAARRYARSLTDPDTAEDAVSDSFLSVFAAIRAGGGPAEAFRPYLIRSVRNAWVTRVRRDRHLSLVESPEQFDDTPQPDGVDDLHESALVGQAFRSLPVRWQTVLWHTTVEDEDHHEVGRLLGLAPNAVAALAFRAREGLRRAYLEAHLGKATSPGCAETHDKLAAYVRGRLPGRQRRTLQSHLDTCPHCSAGALELTGLNSNLGALLAPAVLGTAYVATSAITAGAGASGAGASGAATPGAATSGAGPSGSATAAAKAGSSGSRTLLIAGSAAALALAVSGVALALTSRDTTNAAESHGAPAAGGTAATATDSATPATRSSPTRRTRPGVRPTAPTSEPPSSGPPSSGPPTATPSRPTAPATGSSPPVTLVEVTPPRPSTSTSGPTTSPTTPGSTSGVDLSVGQGSTSDFGSYRHLQLRSHSPIAGAVVHLRVPGLTSWTQHTGAGYDAGPCRLVSATTPEIVCTVGTGNRLLGFDVVTSQPLRAAASISAAGNVDPAPANDRIQIRG